jgi:eukaryotic-like serine/threonine-protein kinase
MSSMKTYFGRPEDHITPVPRTEAAVAAADVFKRGRDTVLAPSPKATGEGGAPLPRLTAEQGVLLRQVDGRRSIARVARQAGLSEDAAIQGLSALYQLGLLVRVEPAEVTIRGQGGMPFYKLGVYEIAARVGQGGMGSVYVCRRIGAAGFQRLFALKVVRQGSGQDEVATRSFVREMKVGRMLTHPNIQSLVDVGMYSDQPFLVLDYIEGSDFEEILSTGTPVPPGVSLAILIDLLRGLQAAHDAVDEEGRHAGLVHGDVSPPNVLVGRDGVARLADFGNSRFVSLNETGENASFAVGKPAFMAPELFRHEGFDHRADLFAAGVMMWTALTGKELFAADSYDQIVNNVLSKEIQPPSAFGAPACLDDVCMRALSRQAKWRYGSADEFAKDLLRVAVTNGLLATGTEVAAHIEQHLGTTLTDRHQRIAQGFRGVHVDAPPPVAAAALSPDAAPVPLVGRKKIAPTVVLPERRPTPPQRRNPPPERRETTDRHATITQRRTVSRLEELLGMRRYVLIGLALFIGVIAFTITASLSGRRPPRRGPATAAATAPAPTPPATVEQSAPVAAPR